MRRGIHSRTTAETGPKADAEDEGREDQSNDEADEVCWYDALYDEDDGDDDESNAEDCEDEAGDEIPVHTRREVVMVNIEDVMQLIE
jgi:hypothetical protein